MSSHLFDSRWRPQQVFNVRRGELSSRTCHNVSRAYNTLDIDSTETTLPRSHHVVDEITRQNTFVLRPIFTTSDLAVQLVLIKLRIGNAVMNGYTQNRQLVDTEFVHFSE